MEEHVQLLRTMADTVQALVEATPQTSFGDPGGMGASGRPASHIDRLAEEKIVELLEQSPLELNLCSEEIGTVDHGAERTLVADPIDGTKNAVRGIPFYCVSLAVTTDGLSDVELGLVRNIPTGDTYLARRGEGATLNGEEIHVGSYESGAALRSPLLGEGPEDLTGELAEQAPHVRGMGAAALEMALVAQGALDVFLHLRGSLRIVDVAASTLLVREAGGVVATPEGDEPELGLDVNERTSLVAACDPRLLAREEVRA